MFGFDLQDLGIGPLLCKNGVRSRVSSSLELSVLYLLSVYLQTTSSIGGVYVLPRHTNLSDGSTAAPAKRIRRAKVSRELPDLAIAAERPCLYILPADLPSSRTPLDTPHRAPARHQPRANLIHCAPVLIKTCKTGPLRRRKASRRHDAPWQALGVLHVDKARGSCGRVAVCLRRHYLMWKSRWLMTGVWFGAWTWAWTLSSRLAPAPGPISATCC